jgi:mercuric reductase
MRGLPATREGEQVFAAVLFDLLHGRAATPHGLRTLNGLGDRVERALSELVQVGAIVRDENGVIVAAYPLSAIPTNHRIQLDAMQPWANCAFDALAVPRMAGQMGMIHSSCGYCGAPIRVAVKGETVRESHPREVIVSYGRLADCGDRPSLEVSCPFINFFCSSEHAQAWERPNGWVGQLLPLHDAVALAVNHFRPIIELYQRYAHDAGT